MILDFFRRIRARRMRGLLKVWHETFGPDRCPVCSYHRFGLAHGYVIGEPPCHDCPEAVDYDTDTALHSYADVGTGLCGLCGEHESWHPEKK